ncbi:protein kinase, partial [candidate division KSB1 bacterium]|nr:protein kinase [candidate division KSB1 bacterium]
MKKIDKYQIFAEIHKGPVTTLYKAFHPQLERTVLIKQLNAERLGDEEIQDRFQQEGLITAKINHPNVIGIYDYSNRDGSPFIVMEFIEGVSLSDVIRDHSPLPVDISVAIMYSMCQGIQALHRKSYLHRDIKPANTLISGEGHVKIGDFGFAGSRSAAGDQILGTPDYMAPEYILSQQISEQSDIFSLGVVFYELLTGENPFRAGSTEACFKKIVNFQPPSIDKIRPELPGELVRLCEAMMQKEAAKRPASVENVLSILATYAGKIRNDAISLFLSQPERYEASALVVESEQVEPARQFKTRRSYSRRLVFISVAVIVLLILIFKIVIPKMNSDNTEQIAATNVAKLDSVQSEKKIAAQPEMPDTVEQSLSVERISENLKAPDRKNEILISETQSDPEIVADPIQQVQIEINTDPRA